MMNSTLIHYPSADAEEALRRSTEMYGDLYSATASEAYARDRELARERALLALDATDGLAEIEPEILVAHPDCIEVLCRSCLPPLTRDRLSALSGVPARRIAALEDGQVPTRGAARRQMMVDDLPAICSVFRAHIDPVLAPWVAEGREGSRCETEGYVALAAERIASSKTRTPAELMLRTVRDNLMGWLEDRGYEMWQVGPDAPLSELPTGMYATMQHSAKGARPAQALFARSAGSGELLCLDVRIFADPVNAIKCRRSLAQTAAGLLDQGCKEICVLFGRFGMPLLTYLEDQQVSYVWYHDLDQLGEWL